MGQQIIEPLTFDGLSIWPPVILAPLAGYTDRVFRLLVRELCCPFAYTEMVSAKGLILGGDNSRQILERSSSDRPLAVQLFGEDPDSMAKAARLVQDLEPTCQVIDINMGCPARKITSQGSGGALLKDIPRAAAIMRAVSQVSRLPVTAKIRVGWDAPVDVSELVSVLSEAGAKMIAIHGRTVSQGYSGAVRWDLIEAAARTSPVPIVGNGDIASSDQAVSILRQGIVSGVMIGRGALSNPLIFRECSEALRGTLSGFRASDEDRLCVAAEHFRRSIAVYGEKRGLLEMRKHLAFYLKGLRNASRLRESVNKETSPEKVLELLEFGWRTQS